MKKFNIDKILLCFGIFFVSIFGVGMIDSFALDKNEFDSYEKKYMIILKYSSYGGSVYRTDYIYKIGSDVPFYLSNSYQSTQDNSKLNFYDENGKLLNLDVLKYRFQTGEGKPDTAPDEFSYSQNTQSYFTIYKIYPNSYSLDGVYTPTFDQLISTSNFDLKTLDGTVVFHNNPLKEVKQVGEAVKNQTTVILPIAIFLMGCLLLVQILRRVLVRFSIG